MVCLLSHIASFTNTSQVRKEVVTGESSSASKGHKTEIIGSLMQDTNNYIYAGSFEQNAINIYNPANGSVSTYVRDPRIGWTDSMWISNEKYLYFIEYADKIIAKRHAPLLMPIVGTSFGAHRATTQAQIAG